MIAAFTVVSICAIVSNCFWAIDRLVLKKRIMRLEYDAQPPKLSVVVQQLINSLEGDNGWVFTPEKSRAYPETGYFASYYENKNAGIRFYMGSPVGGPQIDRPINHVFTKLEIKAINEALEIRKSNMMIEARLKALEQEIGQECEHGMAA